MFVPVAAPDTEAQIATIVCLLNAYDVPHFVHNRYFGGLYPGAQFPLYTLQRIMVPVSHVSEARELLEPFYRAPLPFETERRLRIRDRLRGVVEFALGGWVVACKRWRPGDTDEDT
jgi:hypothetical protein